MSGTAIALPCRSAAFVSLTITLLGCAPGSRSASSTPSMAKEPSAGHSLSPQRTAAGSGQSISADELQGMHVARAEELLAGRFAGVEVFRVPGGISVRIRGSSSVLGSNEPLFIIDGMRISPGPGGALAGINPGDIARIEVLKDVGSTGIYGVEGANGVVIITMKGSR